MSLTSNDLNEMRNIIESALTKQTIEVIKPIQGDLEALSNDIKEIYTMLASLQNVANKKDVFKKSNLEEKILRLHTELVEAAKQANVTLPSH